MVFAIYEQGLRIHTPKEKLLARPGVRQTQETSATRRLMDHNGDAEHNQNISDQTWIHGYPDDSGEKNHPPINKAMEAYVAVEQSKKPRVPVLPAHQVMRSPVITLNADASLNEAWRIMNAEKIHYLVLLDNEGKPTGIVNDRQLLQEAAGIGELSKQDEVNLATMAISTLVDTPLVCASPDTDIRDIARVMLAQKVRAMPIIDDDTGDLLGLVTRSDLMLGLVNQTLEIWT
ncbi:MAG: CBS domain-containing protein [Marinospirillum sp.]|uniref:CBS domain-containing protein n=1 Tax=Marinospirillum sp. TaxID=2183934 RepID=UPI0019DE98D9|nr:CBS domain-containing protein [Marinospirillum sp.]MBE0505693.1 CBS domain-containing protein [Marinospirillum sp.]